MRLRPNAPGAMLEIPGLVTLGEFHRLNADRVERHYQAVSNLSAVWRGHRLSLGAGVHRISFDGALRTRFAGRFLFPTLEDFVAGRPDVFVQAFGDPRTRYSTLPAGLWLQDRWEPRPGLHLELGLRYDRQRMPAGLPSSSDNFSPRLGLAWRPSPSRPLVVRAGMGLFFDRYPLAYLNDALQKNGRNAFEQYAAGESALLAFRAAWGGTLPAPLAGIPPAMYQASPDFPSTHARKFTAGIEHALGRTTTLSLEATHVRGFHLPRIRNVRGALPPLYQLEQAANSDFAGVSVSLNRRYRDNLAYLITYTAGRTRDDASDFDEHPLDPFDAARDWALSRHHQRRRLAASALFELPVRMRSLLPGWLAEVLDEVSCAPILTAGSGRPLNALLTSDVFGTGAFPISARPAGAARNAFLTRATVSLDLRVMKTFRVLNDRAWLQIGVESFNLANRANPERVSPWFATPSGRRLPSYGSTIESLPARQVQLLMQFEY